MTPSPSPAAAPGHPVVHRDAASALLDRLPGADLVRRGLEDTRAGCQTIESHLVEIARPRLERARLLDPAPPHLDSEIQLYLLLGRETPNPHGRYNSLLRELVSFEHALDHRLATQTRQYGLTPQPNPSGFAAIRHD